MILLCDGRMVCGCADPYGKRVLGDTKVASVAEIWNGDTASSLRRDIVNGGSKFCGDCPLKLPLKKDEAPPQRPLDVGALPSRLYIECTAACNISCNQSCCAPETGITRTRNAGMLDYAIFQKVVDEAGPTVGRIDFFNYGEAFLHKRALDMEVTFSIDGATAESYVKYRQRGDFDKAIRNLAALTDEKRKNGFDVPFVNWRYILFNHNDSDAEMELARQMAADVGVDRLSWEITDHPENMFSRRFVPGTPEFERIQYEIWDKTGLGNAIPGATPRARIEIGGSSWLDRVGGAPVKAAAGQPVAIPTRITNLSTRAFPARASYGRRLVRLGAQLCAADGTLINRDYERAWLPEHLQPGATLELPVTLKAPEAPGRYKLKFDLVSEGIDWFEQSGSQTTVKDLIVL